MHHIWPSSLAQLGEGTAVARFTSPLLRALPRQLNSPPLHRILDPGKNEREAGEGTCSFFRLWGGELRFPE